MIAILPPHARPEALALGDAAVEYVGASGPAPAEPAPWRPAGAGRWVATHGAARTILSVSAAPESGEGAWNICIEGRLDRPARIARWGIHLAAPAAATPRYLDRRLRWRPLASRAAIPEFTPLAIAWAGLGAACRLTSARGCCAAELDWRTGMLDLLVLLDAAALHPRWYLTGGPRSEAAPERPAGIFSCVELLVRVGGASPSEPLAVAARYPEGREAGFTLTDHCDFDAVDRLASFLKGTPAERGWRGRGLRLTKGVFTLPSRPTGRQPAPSLHEHAYRHLIESLYADGSEIAPHGLNESGNLDQATFRRALDEMVCAFAPRTWIDHGLSQRYGYATGGADPAGYDLCAALQGAGFSALWAYHDVGGDAARSLDLLAPAGGVRLRGMLASRHLSRGAYAVAAHYVRTQIRDATQGSETGEYLAQAMSTLRGIYLEARSDRSFRERIVRVMGRIAGAPPELRRAAGLQQPEPYHRRDLVTFTPTLYPESALPARHADPHGLYLFASQEVVHTADVYTHAGLQRLLDDRGLHIGHCYLLNRLPYLAGIFGADGNGPSSAWAAFLDALAAAVQERRLWNPTMGALADWGRSFHLTSVVPLHDTAMRITTRSPVPLHDFTLLLPPLTDAAIVRWDQGSPTGTRRWGDWLAVWGRVPANAGVIVRWGDAWPEPSPIPISETRA